MWLRDIDGVASLDVITEFLRLWDLISEVVLHPEVPDVHYWRLSASGQYTAKLAYEALFQGAIQFGPWKIIWKTWAPDKCRFFLWLAAHNRCWTAERLARRNLPHSERCPLCDQDDETIDHLLAGCVFERQFWHIILQRIGLASLSPQPSDIIFEEWWSKVSGSVSHTTRKGLNTVIILGAWTLWRHRNECVFDGTPPNLTRALIMAGEESRWWNMAGAKDLSLLPAQAV
ncbi:hypothetical protein EJB05_06101 [Eragrostis curvula]|uniref:Reverse transcriptase zinc-binding domain-containing protein n=1 Tax=Eragrostis curvula TaxID=38414 RepID=A0A5J9WGM8_9POAL|nr:hypothetical protein EJB05_06101 [Eragrostis curvula]